MDTLDGKVALVTGASRGIGKGIVLALLGEGMTVHATARTGTGAVSQIDPQQVGSLETLARDAAGLPGTLFTHVCDHADDAQSKAVVANIVARHGHIDILVNNAWPGYERMEEPDAPGNKFTWVNPFWEQPMWRWTAMIDTGLRGAFVVSRAAAPAMVARRSGLIVNISFWAAQRFDGNVIYGIAKAGADKMTHDFAHNLREHGVAAVSLYPGLVRTESVLLNAQHFDLSNSMSPQFIGRAVAGLARDPLLMEKSGRVQIAAALGLEYDIADIDGKRPQPDPL
ncbi:SDR family NAD(P)-dependent oxidoreductase [Devosia sp.]|uniref:SDR family NAD(P)-dependent oxidoreductase n=1 Tax=Devosia sp. TaxID=1871048 RepID=UPI003263D382